MNNNNNNQQNLSNNMITAAINQLLSTTSQKLTDEICFTGNENKVSIAAPKNVKFLIPFIRSGINSNESSLSVIDSTTRTITHVKDIFTLNNPTVQSQITNHETDTVTFSSFPNSVIIDTEQPEMIKNDSEEIPLLFNENSNDK